MTPDVRGKMWSPEFVSSLQAAFDILRYHSEETHKVEQPRKRAQHLLKAVRALYLQHAVLLREADGRVHDEPPSLEESDLMPPTAEPAVGLMNGIMMGDSDAGNPVELYLR
jgi:hypothetical protein